MQSETLKKVFIILFIAALHAPLIVYTLTLYEHLLPGQSISGLPWTSAVLLAVLFVLPYAVLAAARIPWNPARARLNEPTSS